MTCCAAARRADPLRARRHYLVCYMKDLLMLPAGHQDAGPHAAPGARWGLPVLSGGASGGGGGGGGGCERAIAWDGKGAAPEFGLPSVPAFSAAAIAICLLGPIGQACWRGLGRPLCACGPSLLLCVAG